MQHYEWLNEDEIDQIAETYQECTDILPYFRARHPKLINDNLLFLFLNTQDKELTAVQQFFDDFPIKSTACDTTAQSTSELIRYCLEYPPYRNRGKKELDKFYQEIKLFISPKIFEWLKIVEQAYDFQIAADDFQIEADNAQSSLVELANGMQKLAQEYVSKHKIENKIYQNAKKSLINDDIQAIKEHRDGSILGDILDTHILEHVYKKGFLKLSAFEQKMYRLSLCENADSLDLSRELDIEKLLSANSHTLDDGLYELSKELIWDDDFCSELGDE